jgi:hypothetical protein
LDKVTTTKTAIKPTVTDNLVSMLNDCDDPDEICNLLSLFDGIEPSAIPIPQLVEIALTGSDNTTDLWLAVNGYEDAWGALYDLISEDPARIPAEPVYKALANALDTADENDDPEDWMIDALTWTFQLALLAHRPETPFPDETVTRLKEHPYWQARQLAVEILAKLDRRSEIIPFLNDDDPDVQTSAIRDIPFEEASMNLLDELTSQDDLADRVRSAATLRFQEMQAEFGA